MRTAQLLTLLILSLASSFMLSSIPASRAQESKQEKHFKAEGLFPEGSQISRGANLLHRPADGNSTSYVFNMPYEKVWLAAHRSAEQLAKFGKCPISEEKEGVILNSTMENMTKPEFNSVRGSWVNDIRTDVAALSNDKTKVKITRRVLEHLATQWVPSNSNGNIERWMLTVIENELKAPTPAPETGPLLSPPVAQEMLTNKDIINLVKSGLPDDLIANKIKQTKCNFNTKTDGLIELKHGGVSSGLIQFILEHPCS